MYMIMYTDYDDYDDDDYDNEFIWEAIIMIMNSSEKQIWSCFTRPSI